MNNTEATRAALAVCQPHDRLWLLAKASHRYGTFGLGTFCRDVGATEQELEALLLDRAARKGLRPASEIIA